VVLSHGLLHSTCAQVALALGSCCRLGYFCQTCDHKTLQCMDNTHYWLATLHFPCSTTAPLPTHPLYNKLATQTCISGSATDLNIQHTGSSTHPLYGIPQYFAA
jgi:hypothetical protein